jgi:hypothetical protein
MTNSCLLFLFCSTFACFGQREKPKNYSRFDERIGHFGFMLGINSADFSVYQKVDAFEQYGLKSLVNKSQPGGQIGIVSTFRLGTPTLRLRFIPTLSFQERALYYTFVDPENPEKDIFGEERVGSTNLDFPLMFQFRTTRFNNFATYVLLGAQYSLDLQSQAEKSQSLIDPFVKIKRDDLQAQAGAGVEFFMPYFKLGIEVKFSHGFVNSFIQDNSPVAKPIDFMYNRVWWLSFIFEG